MNIEHSFNPKWWLIRYVALRDVTTPVINDTDNLLLNVVKKLDQILLAIIDTGEKKQLLYYYEYLNEQLLNNLPKGHIEQHNLPNEIINLCNLSVHIEYLFCPELKLVNKKLAQALSNIIIEICIITSKFNFDILDLIKGDTDVVQRISIITDLELSSIYALIIKMDLIMNENLSPKLIRARNGAKQRTINKTRNAEDRLGNIRQHIQNKPLEDFYKLIKSKSSLVNELVEVDFSFCKSKNLHGYNLVKFPEFAILCNRYSKSKKGELNLSDCYAAKNIILPRIAHTLLTYMQIHDIEYKCRKNKWLDKFLSKYYND